MIALMRRMEEDTAATAATAEPPKAEGAAAGSEPPKKKLSDTVKGGKWTWVVDFEDFGACEMFFSRQNHHRHQLFLLLQGMSDCSPTQAKGVSNLLTHYPERLGLLILLDPCVFLFMNASEREGRSALIQSFSAPARLSLTWCGAP
jgi:hypothetical protein